MRPFSDPFPCSLRAEKLNIGIKKKLGESLKYLIESSIHAGIVSSKDFSLPLEQYYLLLSKLHLHKPSPIYYALNSFLIECFNSQDSNAIKYYLPLLNLISSSNEVQFSSLSVDDTIPTSQIHKLLCNNILRELPSGAEISMADPKQINITHEKIREALSLISMYCPDYHKEMIEFVSEFLVLSSNDLKAGTSFDLFGMIYINVYNANRSLVNMAETLIHEAAHLHLYALLVSDPLILNDPQEMGFSPIKNRERPLVGIFHAAFVLARVLDFLMALNKNLNRKYSSYLLKEEVNGSECLELSDYYQQIARESFDILKQRGKFTLLGSRILESLSPMIHSTQCV